jgi:hypothetical protein
MENVKWKMFPATIARPAAGLAALNPSSAESARSAGNKLFIVI